MTFVRTRTQFVTTESASVKLDTFRNKTLVVRRTTFVGRYGMTFSSNESVFAFVFV